MMNDMGDFGWLPGFGWIFMLLFWGLVILGILAIVKWLATGGTYSKIQNCVGHPRRTLCARRDRPRGIRAEETRSRTLSGLRAGQHESDGNEQTCANFLALAVTGR